MLKKENCNSLTPKKTNNNNTTISTTNKERKNDTICKKDDPLRKNLCKTVFASVNKQKNLSFTSNFTINKYSTINIHNNKIIKLKKIKNKSNKENVSFLLNKKTKLGKNKETESERIKKFSKKEKNLKKNKYTLLSNKVKMKGDGSPSFCSPIKSHSDSGLKNDIKYSFFTNSEKKESEK